MKSTTSMRHWRLLALAAGFGLLSATALAQSPPAAAEEDDEAEEAAAPVPEKKDEDTLRDVDIDKLDWSQLNIDASQLNLPSAKNRAATKGAASDSALCSIRLSPEWHHTVMAAPMTRGEGQIARIPPSIAPRRDMLSATCELAAFPKPLKAEFGADTVPWS